MAGGFSLFTDLITPTKYRVADAPQIDVSAEQLAAVEGNEATFDAAKGLAEGFNEFMRGEVAKSLKAGVPGYADLTSTLAQNLGAQLRGELTASDLAATQRSSAARALGQGIAGSPAGAAFSARNLGLRQYDVQQRAQAQTPGYLSTMAGVTRAPMFDFSSVFMTAGQRIGVSQWNKTNAWNVQNMRNQMAVQPDPWMKALAGFGDSLLTAAGSYATMGTGNFSSPSGGRSNFTVGDANQQNRMMQESGRGWQGGGSDYMGDVNFGGAYGYG